MGSFSGGSSIALGSEKPLDGKTVLGFARETYFQAITSENKKKEDNIAWVSSIFKRPPTYKQAEKPKDQSHGSEVHSKR